jgi:NhaP-type Na+/H+ or K+/H+ antiporter
VPSCRRPPAHLSAPDAIISYKVALAAAGLVILLAALLPSYIGRRPVSLPMVLVAGGAVGFALVPGAHLDPRAHLRLTEHATELGVLISLLGAGLSIDRPPGWQRWGATWRLLGVAMLLTIAGIALAGMTLIGLTPAAALLLGAAIAPTDPVLAADVQVGEPSVDGAPNDTEDQVRLTLTSEAGLNDGLAFPFVFAAVAIATVGGSPDHWFAHWIVFDLLLRLVVGIAIGWLAGKLLARIIFDPPRPFSPLADTNEGFVAVGAILVTYGITEIAHGYGFLAVFVAAITLRNRQRDHVYHKTLHQFTGQIEQLFSVGLLVALGGAVAGGILGGLTWRSAAVGFLVIFVIRPVSARAALVKTDTTPAERRAIEFFGIRGIGSIYYLAYATSHARFGDADELWAATTFTILLSILVHGVSATPVMRELDRRRARRAARSHRRSHIPRPTPTSVPRTTP